MFEARKARVYRQYSCKRKYGGEVQLLVVLIRLEPGGSIEL